MDSNGFLRYSTARVLNVPQYGNIPYSTGIPSSNPTSYSPIRNMPYLANKAPYPIHEDMCHSMMQSLQFYMVNRQTFDTINLKHVFLLILVFCIFEILEDF